MKRLMTRLFFASILAATAAVAANAQCPTAANTIIEVCNDAGGNGTIRAYFFDGAPALSYVLFSLSPPGPVSDPFGLVTVDRTIPTNGAVDAVEFGLVPNGDYIIRVNCSPGGIVNFGGFGINVNSANAMAVSSSVDVDCNPLTGAGNADGGITLTISGGTAPYTISWPTAVTPIGNSAAPAIGAYPFNNLDGGNYVADVTDANNCVVSVNVTVPAATLALAGADQVVCTTSAVLSANAPGTNETGTWTGPPGVTFAPDANTPNATAGNLSLGSNTLTWTISDNTAVCPDNIDQVDIVRNDPATVDAGPDDIICAGSSATLAGILGGSASSGTWSGGAGIFTPNNSTLNAMYAPSGPEIIGGSVTLTLTSDDPDGAGPCLAATSTVTITINPAPIANAGGDQTICAGTTVSLNGTLGGSAVSGTWSGGAGTFAPNNTTLNAVYTPSAGEITAGTVTLTLTTNDPDGAGPCVMDTDNVIITLDPVATADAGPPILICADGSAALNGVIGGSATSATWSGGTGTFNPNNTTLNSVYTPSAAEVTAGTVVLTLTTTGPCAPVADNVTLTINPLPTVSAGADQIICATGAVTLNGSIGGAASSATWSGGTGSFAPNNTTLNAVYTPSAAEITAGTVTLTLTTNDPDAGGPCVAVSEDVTITINPAPTVNPGADQIICAGSTVALNGAVGGSAVSGTWTGGAGSFVPNNTALNAVYTPSAAEVSGGTVTLTLTTNDPDGAGPCTPVADVMTITINALATVNPGVDQVICSGGTVTLNGAVGGSATTGSWSGGGGTFAPDNATLNAVYTPSAAEVIAGTVTLTLTTNDPDGVGPCVSVSDDVTITINVAPTVDAGAAQVICGGGPITLNGTLGGSATSGTWSGGSGTFAPNNTTLNAVYTPSAAEVTAGSVILTLTTNDPDGAGPCTAVSDNTTLTINGVATVSAGVDQAMCAGGTVQLNGAVGGTATTGTWTGGTGTFAPNNTTLNAVYTPSAGEITAGTVTLTLTTNDPDGAGPCVAVAEDVTIIINAPATVDAGVDQTICSGTAVILNGVIGGSAVSGTWSGGTGTFAPNNFTLNASYTPSAAEVSAGSVTLTLTTSGPCAPASQNVLITIDPPATVNAGADQSICAGNTVTLNGGFGGSATGATWTGGTGAFAPDNLTLNAVYTPSAAEVTAGTVTLTLTTSGPCPAVNDAVIITIQPPATANAGADQVICADGSVTLNGTLGGSATSGAWSGGTGTFAPDNLTLNAIYTPSAAEITAGTLTLTLTPAGPCSVVADDITITINGLATVNAGSDQIICAGGSATLAGSFGGSASAATWSGGAGVFLPNNATLNAVYTPSAAEITAGTVTLTLTTDDPDGAGPCVAATEDMIITITAAATVTGGSDQTICVGGTAFLPGTFTGTTGVTWTTSGDGTFSSTVVSNTDYTPGANDISNGVVTLTITTDGPCAPVSDDVIITIVPAPTVDAGLPQIICSSSSVTLNASFGGSATGLTWTSSGDGTFDDVTDVNATYTPGSVDSTNASVTLTATATGSCPGTSDNVTITVNPAAGIDAGSPQTVCFGSTAILNATLSGSASSMTWSTSGDGAFDNVNDPAAIYTPGANDQVAGTVTLTATSNNPVGPCPAVNDNLVITLIPIPGDQTTAGNETWIGYVYTDAGDPGVIPAKINFAPAKYRGFINESDIDNMSAASTYDAATDEFDMNLGLVSPVQGANVCGTFLNNYSIRYKMTKTFAPGVYRFTAGADDGVRLLIDGVNVIPVAAFDLHGYTTYTSAPICLSGSHDVQIDYFDNGAQSRLTFSYQEAAALTTTSPVTLCINSAAPALTASNPDPDVVGFNWYKNGVLVANVAVAGSYTPAATELDMTVAGSETFTVTSDFGCESPPTTVTVDIVNSATLIIDPATVCESGGVVDLRTLITESPTGGAFVFAGHPNISGNDFDPSGLAGNTISITVDYSAGTCTAPQGTLDLTITGTATTTVPVAAVTTCEASADIDLTTLVTAVPTGGVFAFGGPQVTGELFNPSGLSGAQTITVDYNIGGCVAAQKTFQINVVSNAVLTTTNSTACENGSPVNLLTRVSAVPAGGVFTFSGTGVTGNSFNPSGQSGVVNITVDYDVNGCTDSEVFQITVLGPLDPLCGAAGTCASVVIVPKPQPATCTNSDGAIIFSIKPFTPLVNNTGVKITIDGISSTNLSISRTNFNDSIFSALPKGTYDYTIEYGDPSCIKTGQVTIDQSGTVGSLLASNITSPVCVGSSTGSFTLTVPGETGNVLEWSLDGGITDPFKPFTAGGQVTGVPAGPAPSFEQVISVRRNITDPCFASVTIFIPETQQPITATFTIDPASCNGNDGAVTDILAAGGSGSSYTYSINGGVSYQPETDFNGLIGGSYTLRVKDAAGCETDFPANVTFPGFINSNILKQNADCTNDGNSGSISVTITDLGSFEAALSTDQFNEPPDDEYVDYSNPSVTFDELPRGQYFVYLRSNTAACPTRSAPINVFGVYPITFDIEPTCNGSDLSFTLTNVTGEQSGAPIEIQITRKSSTAAPEIIYRQFPADGEIYLDHDDHIFLNTPGEYSVRIIQFQNEVVCNMSSEFVDFTVPVPLFARATLIEESYPDVASGKLHVSDFTGGLNPYAVRIELDSASSFSLPGFETNFEEPQINADQEFEKAYERIPPGRYIVQVMDSLGCSMAFTARVPMDRDLFIPSLFTPNGDGSNDLFFIRNLPEAPSVNRLIISNRWGKEVFSSDNYQNNWDGEGTADGIYYYLLLPENGEARTGWLEIIRGPKP